MFRNKFNCFCEWQKVRFVHKLATFVSKTFICFGLFCFLCFEFFCFHVWLLLFVHGIDKLNYKTCQIVIYYVTKMRAEKRNRARAAVNYFVPLFTTAIIFHTPPFVLLNIFDLTRDVSHLRTKLLSKCPKFVTKVKPNFVQYSLMTLFFLPGTILFLSFLISSLILFPRIEMFLWIRTIVYTIFKSTTFSEVMMCSIRSGKRVITRSQKKFNLEWEKYKR